MKAPLRKAVITGVLLAAALGATAVTASRREPRAHGDGPGLLRLASRLGLSDTQKVKVEEIEDAKVRQSIDVQGRIDYAMYEVRKLMLADEPDRAKVFAKVDELGRLHAEQRKVEIGARLDVRNLLDADQKTKLRDLVADRMARGPRGPRPGPPPAFDLPDDADAPPPPPPPPPGE